MRHATLLRTLDEAAKMQLIQDMTAFEECLGRVTSLQQLPGSAYRHSVYLLYWYKSTNTDAAAAWLCLQRLSGATETAVRGGTQFTCFTCTKEQILTHEELRARTSHLIHCPRGWRYSVYLLYWYKSTNTDADVQEAPGADSLPKEDVLHHLMQRAPLICEAGQAACLFADAPGPPRRRAICGYIGELQDKGPEAAQALVRAALLAVRTSAGSKAEQFVQLAQTATMALTHS